MAMMMGSLYDASVEGGVCADAARRSADEMAGCDNRFAKIRREFVRLEGMAGFNLALAAAVSAKLPV